MSITIEIVEFKELPRATLLGFLTIRIIDLDLIIFDLTVHDQNGKRWIGLPGKPQIGRDKQLITDSGTGRITYVPVLKFASRLASDHFQELVLAAFDKRRVAA